MPLKPKLDSIRGPRKRKAPLTESSQNSFNLSVGIKSDQTFSNISSFSNVNKSLLNSFIDPKNSYSSLSVGPSAEPKRRKILTGFRKNSNNSIFHNCVGLQSLHTQNHNQKHTIKKQQTKAGYTITTVALSKSSMARSPPRKSLNSNNKSPLKRLHHKPDRKMPNNDHIKSTKPAKLRKTNSGNFSFGFKNAQKSVSHIFKPWKWKKERTDDSKNSFQQLLNKFFPKSYNKSEANEGTPKSTPPIINLDDELGPDFTNFKATNENPSEKFCHLPEDTLEKTTADQNSTIEENLSNIDGQSRENPSANNNDHNQDLISTSKILPNSLISRPNRTVESSKDDAGSTLPMIKSEPTDRDIDSTIQYEPQEQVELEIGEHYDHGQQNLIYQATDNQEHYHHQFQGYTERYEDQIHSQYQSYEPTNERFNLPTLGNNECYTEIDMGTSTGQHNYTNYADLSTPLSSAIGHQYNSHISIESDHCDTPTDAKEFYISKYDTRSKEEQTSEGTSVNTEQKSKIELRTEQLNDIREENKSISAGLNKLTLSKKRNKRLKKFQPALTEDEKMLADDLITRSPLMQLISSGFRLEVKGKNARTLGRMQWLDDEIINFYMELINDRANKLKDEEYPAVWATNTFFYTTYTQQGYPKVRRWTKRQKIDIFEKDYLIVPVHLEVHWTVAIADLKIKEITFYDSMGGRYGGPNPHCQQLLNYLDDEHKDKKGSPLPNKSDYKLLTARNNPQQDNGSDCGVFTCCMAENVARCGTIAFNFSYKEMPVIRKKMILEIQNKELFE